MIYYRHTHKVLFGVFTDLSLTFSHTELDIIVKHLHLIRDQLAPFAFVTCVEYVANIGIQDGQETLVGFPNIYGKPEDVVQEF